jgi:uncharacterized 2Fe-2S/4Fe-4S cluster protein (DUF4445 family)
LKNNFALAIDLGTTTLAVSLVDSRTGKREAITGGLNPQRKFGADVVARLDESVKSEEALREMSRLVRTELRSMASELCAKTGIAWNDVKQAAIAGNPAMQHILLGLPVGSLAFPPYRPLFTGGKRITVKELEWDGDAQVYVFPMPGGFVGGDTVAFVYGQRKAHEEVKEQEIQKANFSTSTLFLDLGTNGEMALIAGDTVWATSAAAGPAFEGGNLSCGMAALPGAISSVRIEGERIKLEVIGNTTPTGICGSGVIETVAELLHHGIIEPGGRLLDSAEISSNLANRVINHNGENAFVLYRDAHRQLLLTQNDIRQVQLAKGAIRAGMEVLAEKSRIHYQALQYVLLTGSFGAVLRPEWLKTIGILNQDMVQITRFVPEGALSGVERALAANDEFYSVERLADRFRVVPLSGTPIFEKLFLQNINFP